MHNASTVGVALLLYTTPADQLQFCFMRKCDTVALQGGGGGFTGDNLHPGVYFFKGHINKLKKIFYFVTLAIEIVLRFINHEDNLI